MKNLSKIIKFVPIIFCLLVTMGVSAAKVENNEVKAADVFSRLPVDVLDLLSPSTRLDMLEYWQNDSTIVVLNDLGGESKLINVTDNFLEVQLTAVSTLQIKILANPKNGRQTVMTIYTVGNDNMAKDSDVSFYDIDLKPIPTDKILPAPKIKDFFSIPKGSLTTYKEIMQMIPFPTYLFIASPSDDNLTVKLTIGEAISQDDLKILSLFRLPYITYRWDGSRFKRTAN
ncbi:MAG: DUF3256 family protein [Prevotella sp.]|nr:DUF3256 family protein [Bacteroides sp.]MCM1366477.1 DUF3256 family protein [Prevotella sp.]MCM1436816.1 DUF3256 family protein [Prevotella sp.]